MDEILIKEIRDKIDSIDDLILKSFLERMKLSEQIAKHKAENHMPIEDTSREFEIIEDVSARSGNFAQYTTAFFRTMLELSKDYQENWIRDYIEDQRLKIVQMPGVYGLLGYKLSHSYSEQIHKMLGLGGKIAYDYRILEMLPEELEAFLKRPDIQGINVTIPYKTAVLTFCKKISNEVLRCGAANTIVNKKGKLYAYNTDIEGFKYMVKVSGINVAGKKVLILGSGGASKAIKCALEDLHAGEIIIISRDGPHSYDNLDLHANANIIVNTTPVGMYPNNLEKPISLRNFPLLSGVLDIIYNPELTGLLLEAESLNLPYAGGLHMLVAQARASFELFFDKKLPDSAVEKIVNQLRNENQNIILTGMPGCGKSTIGKALSAVTGREFIDIDKEIEKEEHKSCAEIITKFGEEHFRDLETAKIFELCKLSGKIIALGGGAVLRKENYPALHQNGKIFFIRRDVELLPTDDRPLSKSPETLKEMQKIRLPIYNELSDFQIENNTTVEDAVKQILKYI
ncbi:MAG: hypothetical protein GX241_05960 [Ruminococcaceae bacterium]|nr:hypothetical protein [Oscillospiraceae bacterium]